MNREIDGLELLRMIKNRELKDGTRIDIESDSTYEFYTVIDGDSLNMYRVEDDGEDEFCRTVSTYDLLNKKFYIQENKETEIDIQSIELFDEIRDVSTWSNDTLSFNQRSIISKVNKIIKAIKQLDKKIKE